MTAYRPGDLFVVRTRGWLGWLIRLVTRSHYSHAGVITDASGRTVEAEAKGARYGNIGAYLGRPLLVGSPVPLTDAERQRIVTEATKLLGTPYGYLDILAIGLLQFGIRWRWVRHRVEREDRLICSQLADLADDRAGIHLFTDRRLPQDVTPGQLADLLQGEPALMSPNAATFRSLEGKLLVLLHLVSAGTVADYLGGFGPKVSVVLPAVTAGITGLATMVHLLVKAGAVLPTSKAALVTDLGAVHRVLPEVIGDVEGTVQKVQTAVEEAPVDAAAAKAATEAARVHEAAVKAREEADAAQAAATAAAEKAAAAEAAVAPGLEPAAAAAPA